MGNREHSEITSGYVEIRGFLNYFGWSFGNVTMHESLLLPSSESPHCLQVEDIPCNF